MMELSVKCGLKVWSNWDILDYATNHRWNFFDFKVNKVFMTNFFSSFSSGIVCGDTAVAHNFLLG